MTTISPSSERPLHELRSTPTLPNAPSAPVRLPSVSVPRDDYLQPQGFNPNRRISITDPFLHAYPAHHDGPLASSSTSSSELYPAAPPNLRRGSTEEASILLSAPIKNGGGGPSADAAGELNGHANDGSASRYSGGGPSAGYEFGSSFGGQGQGAPGSYALSPSAGYRFGGPQQNGAQQDGPSHFDYSMRRHSLTHAGQSPPRLPSIPSSPGRKRKSSGEDSGREEGYAYAPNQNGYPPSHLSSAPFPKRRSSGRTYDKTGNLAQSEPGRRDSMMSASGGGGMPEGWEEERRGSAGSYGGGGAYAMGYGPPQGADPYDQRGIPSPGYSHVPAQQRYSGDYDQQLQHPQAQHPGGPRGSVSMGPPPHLLESDMSNYAPRRSSNSLGSGQPSLYSNYSNSRGPPPQQSSMLPTVTHSPPDHQNAAPSPPPPAHPSQHSRPRPPSASYSNLPPAQAAWERAGPLPANAHDQSHPHAGHPRPVPSANLLDPSTAYGPGGSKDSPYSRSPELRVSHKLAERKRRKEMAQLFDELRESLPVDRGLKSSKWEILSKAVEYIVTLKEHNHELSRDNTILREHFGLGPGPQPHAPSSHPSPPSPYGTPSQAPSPQIPAPPQQHPAEQWQGNGEGTWEQERRFGESRRGSGARRGESAGEREASEEGGE